MDLPELIRVREETIVLMMRQMEALHHENQDLKDQLEIIQPQLDESSQLKSDLLTLQESYMSLAAQLSSKTEACDREVGALSSRLARTVSEHHDTNVELSIVRKELKVFHERVQSLERVIRTKDEKIKTLQEKLDRVTSRAENRFLTSPDGPFPSGAISPTSLKSTTTALKNLLPFKRRQEFGMPTGSDHMTTLAPLGAGADAADDADHHAPSRTSPQEEHSTLPSLNVITSSEISSGVMNEGAAPVDPVSRSTSGLLLTEGPEEEPEELLKSLRQAFQDDIPPSIDDPSGITYLPIEPGCPLLVGVQQPAEGDITYSRYGFEDENGGGLAQQVLRRQWISDITERESQQKARFINYMGKRSWTSYDQIVKTDDLKALVRQGIPAGMRAHMWFNLSAGSELIIEGKYADYLREYEHRPSIATQQIGLDLHRTMPHNVLFATHESAGIAPLRRLLTAFSGRNPVIGYCQGMNQVAALLLLVMDEERAFWTFTAILESVLPDEYFTADLLVSRADQLVLRDLVAEKLPRLHRHLEMHGIDLGIITFRWFITLFIDCVPPEIVMRIWDAFLFEGSKVLFRFAMGILSLNEKHILEISGFGPVCHYMQNMTASLHNAEDLIQESFRKLDPFPRSRIISKRTRYIEQVREEMARLDRQRKMRAQASVEDLNMRRL